MSPKTVLVVEDDQHLRDYLTWSLKNRNYDVLVAEDAEKGLEMVGKADLVLLNLKLPKMSGEAFLKCVRDQGNYVPMIVVSGLNESEVKTKLEGFEIVDFVEKPFESKDLFGKINKAMGVAEDLDYIEQATGRLRGFNERQRSR